ncbi:MAG TPA: SPOR domain-containing protein [Sphingomicrobium sp.]|nr:SPOR domain-containing protein [Sphingomicrobium sp.]
MTDERTFEEPLPWLAPVEDEDEPQAFSARRMLTALAVVVVAILIIAGTFFWLGRHRSNVGGPPQLIKAPARPYKVRPPNPGGLNISAESETAFETSAGEDKDSRLNLSRLPETPIAKPPKRAPAAEPSVPAPNDKNTDAALDDKGTDEAPATGGAGSVVQLGAFANQAQAERAWTALSTRFPTVAALNKMIVPYSGGIRLRAAAASPAEAKQVCQALKAAGENCFVAR